MPVQHWTLDTGGLWRTEVTERVSSRDDLVPGTYRPSADTAGVPSGITLDPVAGNWSTTADGQTLENKEFQGKVTIAHHGVTFRNCRFLGGTPTAYPSNHVSIQAYSITASPVTNFYDCTITAGVQNVDATAAIQGRDFNLYRCELTGAVDGARVQNGNIGIYGCWIHDLPWYAYDPSKPDGSHNDGVQVAGGGGNFVLRGNSIEMTDNHTSCIIVLQDIGAVTGCVIDKNWILATKAGIGCATGLNIYDAGSAMSGVVITDNRFSQPTQFKTGFCALVTQGTYDAATISGNVYDDTGLPANVKRV